MTLLETARAAAEAGAQVALDWWHRRAELDVQEKAASDDLVSQADREAEAAVRAVLAAQRPDDAVLGEEGGSSTGTSGLTWVVDPIDGTTSFLYGRADWAVSVAVTDKDGTVLAGVVVEPVLGRTTWASLGQGCRDGHRRLPTLTQTDPSRAVVEVNLGRPDQRPSAGRMIDALLPRVRDVRRGGSAACSLAALATGRADAVWAPGLQPWDCAAGVLLVTEAGGVVGDLAGPSDGRVPDTGDVLAAPPALWQPLRELLAPAYAVRQG